MMKSMSRVAALFACLAAPSLSTLCIAGPAAAPHAGSAEAGATKVAACQACHGPGGNSVNPEWPVLAGQNAAYIEEQLQLLRAGTRWNPIMSPQAMAIESESDVADIAAYFASQTPTGGEADPAYWKSGEKLYRGGDRARGIPPCVACHGPVGTGNPAAGYPALRAQQSVYTAKQLSDYASGARYKSESGTVGRSRNGHMMATIAQRLTADDMRDVAAYVQGMR